MARPSPELEDEVRRLFEDEGVVLLECVLSGSAGRPTLRVVGDRRQGGLTIDDCVRLTRQIQNIVAERRLLAYDYRLEVSSPGLEYPLREPWQFEKNVGRLLKVQVAGERGPKEINGRLVAAATDRIVINSDKTEWSLRYNDLLSARILPEFKPPRMESER
jgi:ribosome maturation factor RimP